MRMHPVVSDTEWHGYTGVTDSLPLGFVTATGCCGFAGILPLGFVPCWYLDKSRFQHSWSMSWDWTQFPENIT